MLNIQPIQPPIRKNYILPPGNKSYYPFPTIIVGPQPMDNKLDVKA